MTLGYLLGGLEMSRGWATCDADALLDRHLAITWKSSRRADTCTTCPHLYCHSGHIGTYISYYCLCLDHEWTQVAAYSMYLRAISQK